MSADQPKTYLCSERLDLIECALKGAGFDKASPRYAGYAAFLVGKLERGLLTRVELSAALQRHHGAVQQERSHRVAERFHRYAIQGLTISARDSSTNG